MDLPNSLLVEGTISTSVEVERSAAFQQQNNFKFSLLGINSHWTRIINRGSIDLNHLWFAEFIKDIPSEQEKNVAQVTIFLRSVCRSESIDQQTVRSKMQEYRKISRGRATHLVGKVTYGAELICRIKRNADGRYEDKDSIELSIYLAAKSYFNLAMLTLWHNFPPPPPEMENVHCTILDNLNPGHVKHGNFQQCCGWVIQVMAVNNPNQKWRPVDIVLCEIPLQMEALLQSEKIVDIQLQMDKNKDSFEWIRSQSRIISKYERLDRVPPLERMLCHFKHLLKPFSKYMEDFQLKLYARTHDQSLKELQHIPESLVAMRDWLMNRRQEIKIICSLVKDTQLPMIDLTKIRNRKSTSTEKRAKVFILNLDYKQDSVMEFIQKIVGLPEPYFKLPEFSIVSSEKKRLEEITEQLNLFNQLPTMLGYREPWMSYQIGLVTITSRYRDGDQLTINLAPMEMPPSRVDSEKASQQRQTSSPLNARMLSPVQPSVAPTTFNRCQQMSSLVKTHCPTTPDAFAQTNAIKLDKVNPYAELQTEIAMPSPRGTAKVETPPPPVEPMEHDSGEISSFGDVQDLDSILKDNSSFKTANAISNAPRLVKPDAEIGESLDRCMVEVDSTERHRHDESASGNSIKDCKQDISSSVVDKTRRANEQRADEYFAQKTVGCSQLVEQGKPNVYLLNAKQI